MTGPCTKALDSESEVCPACFRQHPPRKPEVCPDCHGLGGIQVYGCTCGAGPGGYYGMHEPGCGLEPCPRGCEYDPDSERQ